MYRLLVRRHLFSRVSKPAVRWMTRFAFAGFAVAMFSWVTVHSVMSGLQKDRIQVLLDEQPHVLWESTPRLFDDDLKSRIDAVAKRHGASEIHYVLQTEGLVELIRPDERGRAQGAGIVMRADPELAPGEVAIGGELAMMTDLTKGTELRLRSIWNLEGVPLVARVSDFHYPRNFQDAKQLVSVSPADLESLIEQRGASSRIEIRLPDPERAEALRADLNKLFPEHWHTWRDLNRSLLVSLALERNMMALAMFFLVVLASLALYLSLSVRVVERTRQSALLLALGARMKVVRNVFLFEGFVIGAIGTTLGVVLSLGFCWFLKNHFQLPEMYYSRSIPVDVSGGSVLGLTLLAMTLALVASYFPAQQVSKIEIAEALK
ncbi:MAG TPA: FtsX-like permease family protein [Bdellovibrionota bacterium]|jgi:lipoprotein-releasing system permease protein|nr:FtsX-like permease family protein [Bdellovibrionota bacterium]